MGSQEREPIRKVITSDISDCFLPKKSFTAVQVSNAHEITNKNEEMQSPICQFLNTKLLCCLRVNDRGMGSFFSAHLGLAKRCSFAKSICSSLVLSNVMLHCDTSYPDRKTILLSGGH